MLRGERIGSIGYSQDGQIAKGRKLERIGTELNGKGEAKLADVLSKPSATITRKEAQEILGAEMCVADFIRKHSESLLLWDDDEKLGTVRE